LQKNIYPYFIASATFARDAAVFTAVYLPVCEQDGSQSYWKDFREIWGTDGSRTREALIKFWKVSGNDTVAEVRHKS